VHRERQRIAASQQGSTHGSTQAQRMREPRRHIGVDARGRGPHQSKRAADWDSELEGRERKERASGRVSPSPCLPPRR